MKKNIFGENVENISLPQIDFNKAFKVGILLIGIVGIFQLKGISDRLDKGNRNTGNGLPQIVYQLQDIKERLK